MIFESDRIIVRKLTYSDIPIITGWWNNGQLMKDMGFKDGLGVTKNVFMKDLRKSLMIRIAYWKAGCI